MSSDTCSTQCATCSRLCLAQPVFDIISLHYYASNNCSTLIGSLFIVGMPYSITDDDLVPIFSSLAEVRGDVIIRNNQYLTSLAFLQGLSVINSLAVESNPSLCDARLPSLSQVSGTIHTHGNPRLCPQNYPRSQNYHIMSHGPTAPNASKMITPSPIFVQAGSSMPTPSISSTTTTTRPSAASVCATVCGYVELVAVGRNYLDSSVLAAVSSALTSLLSQASNGQVRFKTSSIYHSLYSSYYYYL